MTVRLTFAQQKVVDHDGGALLVVAGPGSGKTRVLVERVRRLLNDPSQHFRILALTFTNKAANEMVERLDDIPNIRERAFVGTLHSFCMEVLANRGKPLGINGLPNIFESFEDRKQILLNAVRSDPSLSAILTAAGDVKEQQRTLGGWLGRIGDLKNSLVLPSMVEDGEERLIYELYDAGLRASAAVDYDDLLLLTYRLFQERPRTAELYQRQYRYICIDEAQDLNEAQYRLLGSLCGSSFRNVMLVGDPKQAIYVWNGADPKFLDLFERDYNATKIVLTENFRSSKEVVDAAKRLEPSYSVEGQLPIRGEVRHAACDDEVGEAKLIVKKLQELISSGHSDIEGDISLSKCAILGRSRYVFKALEDELRDCGIPHYKKFSSAPYQSESETFKEFELCLRLLANPQDKLHLAVLEKAWGANSDRVFASSVETASSNPLTFLHSLAEAAQRGNAVVVINAVDSMGWTNEDFRFLSGLSALETFSSGLDEEDRFVMLQDINEWRKHWDYYVRSEPGGHHSVGSFLGQVALGTTQQPKEPGVALLTVHASKGLEFDVVFLMGMSEGTFPDYRAKGAALEEERRSAFVAVTRSKRLLYVTYPKTRTMPWGAIKLQRPSRFLAAVSG